MAGNELIEAAEEKFSTYLVTAYQAGEIGRFRPYTVSEDVRDALTITFHTMGKTIARQHFGGADPATNGSLRQSTKSVSKKNWYEKLPTNVFDENTTATPKARLAFAKAIVMSLIRREDQECIEALRTATFTSANSIVHGSVGFTYVKWTAMLEFFEARGVAASDICLAISEKEARQLLHETRMISSDYRVGTARPTTEAQIATELGIGGVIKVGSVQYSGEGGLILGRAGATIRDCYAWDKNRLGLADNTERKSGISWDVGTLSNVGWGIQAQAATVIDDVDGDGYSEGVYRIECDASVALT